MKQQELEDEVEVAAKRLAGDVDLFGEVDGEDQSTIRCVGAGG